MSVERECLVEWLLDNYRGYCFSESSSEFGCVTFKVDVLWWIGFASIEIWSGIVIIDLISHHKVLRMNSPSFFDDLKCICDKIVFDMISKKNEYTDS